MVLLNANVDLEYQGEVKTKNITYILNLFCIVKLFNPINVAHIYTSSTTNIYHVFMIIKTWELQCDAYCDSICAHFGALNNKIMIATMRIQTIIP
jgi:hypothetical protein